VLRNRRGRHGGSTVSRDFRLTLAARAQRDPKFRQALFTEAITAYLAGDTLTGKAILRDLARDSH